MGIFSGNTVEWMLAMQAGNYYSIYTGEQHWTLLCSCRFHCLVHRATLHTAMLG
jgi:hypothetical protein